MGRKGKKLFGRALTDAAGIPPELVSSLPLFSMTGPRKSCSLKISKEFLPQTGLAAPSRRGSPPLPRDPGITSFSCLLHEGCAEAYRNHHQHLLSDQLTGGIFHDGENPALHQGLCEDPGPEVVSRRPLLRPRPSRFLHMGSHPKKMPTN